MVRLIDPPRLTESQVEVPENIRELLRSAQRDTPTLSEIAVLKQKLAPVLNAPPATGGILGPLNGSITGLGKIVVISTFVAVSGLTYWSLQNQTTDIGTAASSVDRPKVDPQSTETQKKRDIDLLGNYTTTALESTNVAADLQPTPPLSEDQKKRDVTRSIRVKPIKKANVNRNAVPTAEPEAPVSPSIQKANAQNEMDEAALLSLARNALPKDPAQTLRLTFEHYRKFGTGVLGEEREVLIIEALVRLGRKDEAQARTRNFLAVYPQSVYRRRLSRQVFDND